MNPSEIKYIIENENSETSKLLLSRRSEEIDLPLCVKCIQARKKMKIKVPLWYSVPSLVYPFSLSVEQCSSQSSALYKYSIAKRIIERVKREFPASVQNNYYRNIADITGGMGVDSYFISDAAENLYYFEKNKELSESAAYNFAELGNQRIIVKNLDIEGNVGVLEGKELALIYADPARRESAEKQKHYTGITAAGKMILIDDYEPNIIELKEELFKYAPYLLLKISPMADIKLNLKLLPETTEIHIVSVNNECKELLFLLKKNSEEGKNGTIYKGKDETTREEKKQTEVEIDAINIIEEGKQGRQSSFKFTYSEEANSTADYFEIDPNDYPNAQGDSYSKSSKALILLEPNKSLLKAGAFKTVARRYAIEKIAPSTHLYTTDAYRKNEMLTDFPGKVFSIEAIYSFNHKTIKSLQKTLSRANLCARNFPLNTNTLRQKMRIKEGGEDYLFAITLNSGERVIIHALHLS
jgi:hypothetical protein